MRLWSDSSMDWEINGYHNRNVRATIESASVVRVAVMDQEGKICLGGDCAGLGYASLSSVDMNWLGGRTAYGRDRLRMGVHELLPNW